MSAPVASLPMYDLPELRAATDALWAAIARALGAAAPATLERSRALDEVWRDRALVLSQTCGYVVTHALRGAVRLVAAPRYRAPGCDGATYSSALVVGREHPARQLADLRGGSCAINGADSHSGMNVLRHAFAPLAAGGRFFARTEVSGAHRESLARVAAGAVDVAAIDCVSLALLARVAPAEVAAVRVLATTASAPALPFVTRGDASDEEVAVIRAALREAIVAEPLAREVLLLAGVEEVDLAAYDAIDALEREAIGRGYPVVG